MTSPAVPPGGKSGIRDIKQPKPRFALSTLLVAAIIVVAPNALLADLDSVVARVSGTDEEIFTVSTYEPQVPAGRKISALFLFHGGEEHKSVTDGADKSYRDAMAGLLKKSGLEGEFVVIAPHSPGRGWRWDAHKIDVQLKLRQLTAWAFQRYSIDPRRVYYSGRSNGGSSSGPIMIGQPTLFAALFPWTGGPEGVFDGLDPKTGPDWYLVASGGETAYWSNEIFSHLHKMEARGYHAFYREPQGFTHGSVHQRNDVYEDGFRWFLALRNKAVPPPPEDQSFLEKLAVQQPFNLSADNLTELERIGGSEAGRIIRLALKSNDAAARLAAAGSCTRMIYGAEVWNELIALANDADTPVRLKAIEAFGVHARWRYFDALERLSKIALDRARPAADRLAATRAIDFAVLLDAPLGLALDYPQRELNLRETRALWTWIDLLTDDSAELRQLSAEALQRHHPENKIGYDANAATDARRTAATQWESWGVGAMGEKYRPTRSATGTGVRRFTLTIWSNPPNARIIVDHRLIGPAPAAISIEGTPDRRFLAPTQIVVDAISTDLTAPSRLNVRWFGAGDLIPESISSASGDFRVLY